MSGGWRRKLEHMVSLRHSPDNKLCRQRLLNKNVTTDLPAYKAAWQVWYETGQVKPTAGGCHERAGMAMASSKSRQGENKMGLRVGQRVTMQAGPGLEKRE